MSDQPPTDSKAKRASAPRKRSAAKRVGAPEAPAAAKPRDVAAAVGGSGAKSAPASPDAKSTGSKATGVPKATRKPRRGRGGTMEATQPARTTSPASPASDAHRPVVEGSASRPAYEVATGDERGGLTSSQPVAATHAVSRGRDDSQPSAAAQTAPGHAATGARTGNVSAPDAAPSPPSSAPASADVTAVGAEAAKSSALTASAANVATPAIARQEALRPGELIRVALSVRWRDLDAFNHVNNSKYLSYLEEARLRWMLSMPGMGMDDNVAPVVAASTLNYRRPVEWPGDVVVELFVERLGGSSLTIGHRIVDANDGGVLYCDGNVVMVWIDRTSGRSSPLPASVRQACS